jgi:hypothetical protein
VAKAASGGGGSPSCGKNAPTQNKASKGPLLEFTAATLLKRASIFPCTSPAINTFTILNQLGAKLGCTSHTQYHDRRLKNVHKFILSFLWRGRPDFDQMRGVFETSRLQPEQGLPLFFLFFYTDLPSCANVRKAT